MPILDRVCGEPRDDRQRLYVFYVPSVSVLKGAFGNYENEENGTRSGIHNKALLGLSSHLYISPNLREGAVPLKFHEAVVRDNLRE